MGKRKKEKKKSEKKVWKCQRCKTILDELPPEFSDGELEQLEAEGKLFCLDCARKEREAEIERARKEREKHVFKGELTLERETWKPMLKYAKRLLEEATFRINGNTVTLCELDESRVAMLKAVIHRESLDDHIEKQPDRLFRVDLATFTNAIRQAGYPAQIKSDGGFLYFKNHWGNYRMPLLSYDTEMTSDPKTKYTAHTSLDISKIFDKMKWIHDKPDRVKLIAKDGKLRMKVGNGVGEHLEAEIGESKGEAEAVYNLAYLEVLKEQYSSEKWEIEFASELPLHAKKTKRVGEQDSVQLDFWLANRID